MRSVAFNHEIFVGREGKLHRLNRSRIPYVESFGAVIIGELPVDEGGGNRGVKAGAFKGDQPQW